MLGWHFRCPAPLRGSLCGRSIQSTLLPRNAAVHLATSRADAYGAVQGGTYPPSLRPRSRRVALPNTDWGTGRVWSSGPPPQLSGRVPSNSAVESTVPGLKGVLWHRAVLTCGSRCSRLFTQRCEPSIVGSSKANRSEYPESAGLQSSRSMCVPILALLEEARRQGSTKC